MGQVSERETSGGEGVEFVSDVHDAQQRRVTVKRYHLSSRLPVFVRLVLPKTAMVLTENAWRSLVDASAETSISSAYMADSMTLRVETRVFENDNAAQSNVFGLDAARLKLREVELIDWVAEHSPKPGDKDYVAAEDARVFRSAKTGRGPLPPDWQAAATAPGAPTYVCVYKLLTFEFKWFGIQTKAEAFLVNWERGLFTRSQRLVWCMQDQWHGMTQTDIEQYLADVAKRLSSQFGSKDAAAAAAAPAPAIEEAAKHEHHHHVVEHHHHEHHEHHEHHHAKADDDDGRKDKAKKKHRVRKAKAKKTDDEGAAAAEEATADDDNNDDDDDE